MKWFSLIWSPISNDDIFHSLFEPPHDKTNKMVYVPSEDSDQPGHPPSLIRVFTVCIKKALFLTYLFSAQRRLLSDWADAQADLSLRRAQWSFCRFCHEAALFSVLYLSLSLSSLSFFPSLFLTER